MFKVLKARKPRKCEGYDCDREIPAGSLYIQYKTWGYGFVYLNESLCLECGYDQICHSLAWCLEARIDVCKANLQRLIKENGKFAGLFWVAREVQPGVYVVGKIIRPPGFPEFHHPSIWKAMGKDVGKHE